MSLLAETSALLGDGASAAVLYRLLLPWAKCNAADHPEGIRGSISRYLGLLAATTKPCDEAEHVSSLWAQLRRRRAESCVGRERLPAASVAAGSETWSISARPRTGAARRRRARA